MYRSGAPMGTQAAASEAVHQSLPPARLAASVRQWAQRQHSPTSRRARNRSFTQLSNAPSTPSTPSTQQMDQLVSYSTLTAPRPRLRRSAFASADTCSMVWHLCVEGEKQGAAYWDGAAGRRAHIQPHGAGCRVLCS